MESTLHLRNFNFVYVLFFRLGYQHRSKYITALNFPSRPVNLTVVTGQAKGRPAEPRSQVAVQTSNNNHEKHLFSL